MTAYLTNPDDKWMKRNLYCRRYIEFQNLRARTLLKYKKNWVQICESLRNLIADEVCVRPVQF